MLIVRAGQVVEALFLLKQTMMQLELAEAALLAWAQHFESESVVLEVVRATTTQVLVAAEVEKVEILHYLKLEQAVVAGLV